VIENLSLFFYVVDSGGFTQASRRTGIGKATISRRISELEQELAVALLHRNARQLVMTEAGERLFIRARTIVEEAEAAKSEALDCAGEAKRASARIVSGGVGRSCCGAPGSDIHAAQPARKRDTQREYSRDRSHRESLRRRHSTLGGSPSGLEFMRSTLV